MIPRMVAGEGRRAARTKASELIEAVGLTSRQPIDLQSSPVENNNGCHCQGAG